MWESILQVCVKMKKIIITAKCHQILIDELQAKNYEVVIKPTINYSQLLQEINEYIGLITTTSIVIDKPIIDAANQLQFIGRLGSGMEHIDVQYANSKNIKCVSSPEGNCNAVAEHCVGMLISLTKNINKSYHQLQQGFWLRNENRGEELNDKTIAIIGFGHTGSAFAQKLKGFNVRILAHDIYKNNFNNDYIQQAKLQQIFNEADIVSMHLPATSLTKHYANAHFFNSFKKPVCFLNTSRGDVVNTNDLIAAIQQKKVLAAALDVLENEKLETYTKNEKEQLDFLLHQPNLIITPHIAGYSQQSFYLMAKVLLNKLNL